LNPCNRTLTAGGSSGGEGALVALRGSLIGIGTDIAGSVRIPSLCCGTYGFKPSSNRVPYGGQANPTKAGSPGVPPVAGPLATSFADLEFLLKSVIQAKPWDFDALALSVPWRDSLPAKQKLRIGVFGEDSKLPCWPPIRRALSTAVEKLKSAGHEIVTLEDAPSFEEGLELAYASFGFDNTHQSGKYIQAGEEPLVGSVRQTMEVLIPKSGGWKLEEVFDHNVQKNAYFQKWNKVFVAKKLDCIIAPGAQTTATPHDTYGAPPYTAVWNTLEVSSHWIYAL